MQTEPTLLCFSGNQIRLGHYAGLSPIDITIVGEDKQAKKEEIELTSIDYFMEFTKECQEHIQQVLQSNGVSLCAGVGSDLLCRLVEQVGALKVGQYYRARTLTGHYAEELLDAYMLQGLANAKGRRDTIIRSFLFRAPVHELHLDYHMCADLGLVLQEMPTSESDATKHVTSVLDDLAQRNIICPNVTDTVKMPFIALYSPGSPGTSQAASAGGSHGPAGSNQEPDTTTS